MADPELIIDAEPDWSAGIDLSYGFQTVVSTSPRFVEQRRPLYPYVTRSLSCSFVLEGEHGQSLINKLIYGKALLLCVPIYSEPIFTEAITAGASSITATEDLSYFWNIQNCNYAIAINFVTGASQMLLVASTSGTTINLSAEVGETFDATESIIYPAFPGIVKSFKKADITDLICSVECEFEESKLQSEEYDGTEVTWSDPQICQDVLFMGSSSPSASPSPSPFICPDFDPYTIAGFTERDPDGFIAASGSDVTVNCTGPATDFAYLQKSSGLSFVSPWFRFKLEVRGLSAANGASMRFYSTGESSIGIQFGVSSSYGGGPVSPYMVISADGPFGSFDGEDFIFSSNFDRWIQVRIDPGFLYVDVYLDSNFSNLESTARSINTGWVDPITVTGVAAIILGYGDCTGLLMSIRNFSICEE